MDNYSFSEKIDEVIYTSTGQKRGRRLKKCSTSIFMQYFIMEESSILDVKLLLDTLDREETNVIRL